MRLSQVALSVADVRRSQAWYRDVVGLEPAGGTNLFAGPLASMVQGVPRSASTCWWLVDRQDQFQLELFEFRSPPVREFARTRRPCDVGYVRVGFHVADFDAAIQRVQRSPSEPLTGPVGDRGTRRACLRDPDGVLVELMEDDPRSGTRRERPRAGIPAVTRAVTLSVPSLERSRRFLVDTLGLEEARGVELHTSEHEALWGLEGAEREAMLLWADDLLLEVVEYTEPRGEAWPAGYRISDLGLLNVAFGFRDRAGFEDAWRRCREAGYESNGRPLRLGPWSVVYVNDDQGFSFELLHVAPWYEGAMGFRPRSSPRLAPFAGRAPVAAARRRERAFTRAVVTGAAGGIGTELCRLLAADGTEIVAIDRNAQGLARLEDELGGVTTVEPRPADLSDLEAVDGLARDLADAEIDLLVACAGLDRAQSMLSFDWRQARDDFAVNALSSVVLFSHLLPGMARLAERRRGEAAGGESARAPHVTALISLAGLFGLPYEAAYSGSKAAMAAIVESARAELGRSGVGFTLVFPGFVDTPMFRANAFRHTYSVRPRDAAERIHAATLARRATLGFPPAEHAKVRVAKLLPARLRDRLARSAMNPSDDLEPPVP